MVELNKTEEFEEGISLFEIFELIYRRKILLLLIIVLSFISGIIYLNFTEKKYQSTVTILVDPIKKSSTIGSVLSSDFFDSSDDISTEVQLLTNITTLSDAISYLDLSKYSTSEGVLYSEINILSFIKNEVSVNLVKDTNLVEVSITDSNPNFAADFANVLAISFNDILSKFSTDSKNTQILFLEEQIPEVELELKEANDKLFEYKAKTGIDFLSNNSATLVNNISYLEMKKKPLELEYFENLLTIEEYQESYNKLLPSLEICKNDTYINSYLNSYKKANKEIIYFDLSSNINSWNTTNLSVVNDNLNDTVNQRISQLNSLMNEAENLIINRLDEIHEAYEIEIDDYLISKYNLIILDTLTCELAIENIENAIISFEDNFNQLPEIEKELSTLQSDVDSLEAIRKELNSLLEQVSLTAAANTNNVKIVSPAVVSVNEVSPNKLLILAVSILLGAALGFLLCLLLHMIDDTIHTVDDLKVVLNNKIPLLGWIPYVIVDKKCLKKQNYKNSSMIMMDNYVDSYIYERYKLVASNILYGKSKSNKIIAVTSSLVNEGKSHLVASLGICLSNSGYKVLLIDADLKAPSLRKQFGLKHDNNGYINLFENNDDLHKAIVTPYPSLDNLKLISPGKSELSSSIFMKNTLYKEKLDYVKENYDYILVDLPPFEFALELKRFMHIIDSILICSRIGICTKTKLNILLENLGESEDKIGGVIATACPKESVKKYVHKYDSYYRNSSYRSEMDKDKQSCFSVVKKEKQMKKIYKKSLKSKNK
ncbi:MAG: GumC family protein [Pleomorphochaeta sp.]